MFLTVPCNGSSHDTQNWLVGAIIWGFLSLKNITIEINSFSIHLREGLSFSECFAIWPPQIYISRTEALWSYEGGDGTGRDNFAYVEKWQLKTSVWAFYSHVFTMSAQNVMPEMNITKPASKRLLTATRA